MGDWFSHGEGLVVLRKGLPLSLQDDLTFGLPVTLIHGRGTG